MKVGIAGFGFMGRMHYACWQAIKDAQVIAICDDNPNIAKDTQQAVGNIDPATNAIDLHSLSTYSDFDRMLSDENLDTVSITLPTHLHAEFSTKALHAGVNVLCEKPMALNVAECEKMIEASKARPVSIG